MSLCEFKATLIHIEFQVNRDYTVRPCPPQRKDLTKIVKWVWFEHECRLQCIWLLTWVLRIKLRSLDLYDNCFSPTEP